MQPIKFIRKMLLIVSMVLLSVMLFAGTALAQSPTPVPPSGSNPQSLAPTDIPPDMSLLGVLIFFVVLCVWQIIANFFVRSRVFSDQVDQPGGTQPEAPQMKIFR